jgi:hypothetical protein
MKQRPQSSLVTSHLGTKAGGAT